ncbi:hypothetical protein JTE90_002217 [Oedothorax gibbosus]|uniref:Uncharacterized protein n=1 Tax=Oedothorax gibbosus TaxID=931172 RepID=A0AAV6TDV5_9ARAC|nr:hypothetical protein JTE90_002217 [Oedothorax gibbosus]
MKVTGGGGRRISGSPFPRSGAHGTAAFIVEVAEFERTRWDPKGWETMPGQDEARGNSGGGGPLEVLTLQTRSSDLGLAALKNNRTI